MSTMPVPAPGAMPPPALRPPADGECQFCGAQPAAHTQYQSVTSIVILYVISSQRGWMCRNCGLATFRHHTNKSLVGGWWGIGVIAIPIMLIANRLRLGRILRLAPPQPTPGVAAQLPAPLDPGKPVMTRSGGIVTIVVLASLVLVVACGVLVALLPS
ncbi:hypothetical protein V6V47_06980 [Micromonospora sp. CPCC 205539]|uniref:hypothetical protein n=1 Tax=Micromonospora sp. CPCC 205539 TaxID=3122408 RepID=UPI002FF3D1F0